MKQHTPVVVVAAFALLASMAAAQQDIQTYKMEHQQAQPPMGRPEPQPQMMPQPAPMAGGEACPMCQMNCPHGQGRGAMEMHMRQAGVPEETIASAQMLMKARVSPADPQGLLGMQDQLSLTPEQVDELKNIIDSQQERALAVLTPDQWRKVRQLKPQAMSMMDMHETMMPFMSAMREQMRGQMRQGGGMRPMMPGQQPPYGKPLPEGTQQQAPAMPMKPESK